MGATVFEAAKIFALPLSSGKTGYVWFEKTYDKKDGPARSHWCTMEIGDRQKMIDRVFGLAHALPGGSLQILEKISIVGFIDKLIKQVNEPLWIDEDVTLNLGNSQRGFYDPITDCNRAIVSSILEAHGQHHLLGDIAKPVRDGGKNIVLSLREHFEMIEELANTPMTDSAMGSYNSRPVSFCWQLIPTLDHVHAVARKIDFDVSAPTMAPPKVQIWEHKFTSMHLSVALMKVDGKKFVGDPSSIERKLIEWAKDAEPTHPGYYRWLFDAFKRTPKNPFPMDLEFQFDLSKLSSEEHLRDALHQASMHYLGTQSDRFTLSLKQLSEAAQPTGTNVFYWTILATWDSTGVCTLVFPSKADAASEQAELF
jgi:hypothetical protein